MANKPSPPYKGGTMQDNKKHEFFTSRQAFFTELFFWLGVGLLALTYWGYYVDIRPINKAVNYSGQLQNLDTLN